jgi:hypothetical protein
MHVLVRVHVRDGQAALLDLADLRLDLGSNLIFIEVSAEGPRRESQPAIVKARAGPIRNHQARNIPRREQRRAIDQHHVAADAQPGLECACDRIAHGAGVSHHGSRRNYSPLVRFHDGAVHPGGQPEIVSIDDQPPHAASVQRRLASIEYRVLLRYATISFLSRAAVAG